MRSCPHENMSIALKTTAITPMPKGLELEQGGRVHPTGHKQEIRFHLGRPGWSPSFLSTCSLEMPSLIPKCRDLHLKRSQQWLRWRKPSSTTPSSLSPPSPESRCLQLVDRYQGEVTYWSCLSSWWSFSRCWSLLWSNCWQNLTGGSPPREITSKLTA